MDSIKKRKEISSIIEDVKEKKTRSQDFISSKKQNPSKTRQEIDSHLSLKNLEIRESGLWLQIEKLEAKLKRYRRDNEELRDTNTNLEVIIKIHEM